MRTWNWSSGVASDWTTCTTLDPVQLQLAFLWALVLGRPDQTGKEHCQSTKKISLLASSSVHMCVPKSNDRPSK